MSPTITKQWDRLQGYLQSGDGGDVLDEAVWGSLTVEVLDDLLADFGLAEDAGNRRSVLETIDRLLGEGF